jgi:3-phenylpropionate/trans-cinnamate dioxygenase ferredoxin component
VSGPPAKTPVRTHQVVVQDGMVYVQRGVSADGAA